MSIQGASILIECKSHALTAVCGVRWRHTYAMWADARLDNGALLYNYNTNPIQQMHKISIIQAYTVKPVKDSHLWASSNFYRDMVALRIYLDCNALVLPGAMDTGCFSEATIPITVTILDRLYSTTALLKAKFYCIW